MLLLDEVGNECESQMIVFSMYKLRVTQQPGFVNRDMFGC